MKLAGLPDPTLYSSWDEWALAITQVLQTGNTTLELQPSDKLPIIDTEGRTIVETTGITVYDSDGNTPVAKDIVTIDTTHLADAAVETNKLANAAVTGTKIASATIGTANIGAAAITTALLGDAAVTTAKIDELAVNSAKIANLAVGTLKIAGEAVTAAKVLKNEIVEINSSKKTTVTYVDPVAGAVKYANGTTFIANGGECILLVTLDLLVDDYDETDTDYGPLIVVSIWVENVTTSSTVTSLQAVPVALQPRNITMTTTDWHGGCTLQYGWETTESPFFTVGDEIDLWVAAQLYYYGSAAACDLKLQDPNYTIIQSQE